MTKFRVLFLLLTFLVVGIVGTAVFYYARGFRFDEQTGKLSQNGLLVIKSVPDSAQLFINGELKTATDATLTLAPATYDISVRKEGYSNWEKRITIEKETVSESTAHLFKVAPSLSAITFTGVQNPHPSPDLTKISYVVSASQKNSGSEGLWVMEMINLPIGFSRDPKRITDGDLSDASWIWSPDSREILLSTLKGTYLLDSSSFTGQSQRINVALQRKEILAKWNKEKKDKLEAQTRKLPDEIKDILGRKSSAVVFSPDENMILYTASSSAEIPPNLIKQLPGSSTQKQERNIKVGQSYVYDIKEDRNFLISEEGAILTGWVDYAKILDTENWKLESDNPVPNGTGGNSKRSLAWYPSSRHIISSEEEKVIIMDYDATNKQTAYSGSYIAPFAFPVLSLDRLLILTNLGAITTPPNLYSLSIK